MSSQLMPIPEEFYAFENGQPFTHCQICNRPLLTGNSDYFIEKVIRNYPGQGVQDVVYEYAVCWHCAEENSQRMSEESLINIQAYFNGQMAFLYEAEEYRQRWPEISDPLPDHCLITGLSKAELDEYMIYGHFRGDQMVRSTMPYLFSSQVLDELGECLSAKTRDELDDFRDKYFGDPPELDELWKSRRPVFF